MDSASYDVEPLERLGNIQLGMSRAEVRQLLGQPQSTNGSRNHVDIYLDGSFQVFYSPESTVEFIEVTKEAGVPVQLAGVDVFQTPAQEVLHLVSSRSEFDQNDPVVGYSYVFPDLELSLWRPDDAEPQQGKEQVFFSALGIGARGYFSEA